MLELWENLNYYSYSIHQQAGQTACYCVFKTFVFLRAGWQRKARFITECINHEENQMSGNADEPILFDENLYEPGRVLVFECKACHKQFKLRLTKLHPARTRRKTRSPCGGHLVVIENVFHLKQEIPLYEGDNVVGRHVKEQRLMLHSKP